MVRGTDQVVVVGGGFYGCIIAEYLARRGARVVLIEREQDLLLRASYRNQARLHGGYHYPRSLQTAYRSRINFDRFLDDFGDAVHDDFSKLYAIGRSDSKITPAQFERFCDQIGAPYGPVDQSTRRLFEPRLIAAVYQVEEYALDLGVLREIVRGRLERVGVEVRLGVEVVALSSAAGRAVTRLHSGAEEVSDWCINCTYARLRTLSPRTAGMAPLKHEVAEIALVESSLPLEARCVTVMDGPFFSLMPFPDRGCDTLTHVRYTPHFFWIEGGTDARDPYAVLDGSDLKSRFPYMIRDAARYMPGLASSRHIGSMFEIKTVLERNEVDDGRPILCEQDPDSPRVVFVLGSKLDNVYDVLTYFDGVDG